MRKENDTMKAVVLFGRIFFSLIFLNTIFAHFSEQGINYAASAGVPIPGILVPLSGVIAILGGLSLVFGYKAKAGAWLIVVFLIPVTLWMHNFWAFEGAEAQTQMINFVKNLSLLGGAFLITYFGAGPLSFDHYLAKRAGDSSEQTTRKRFEPDFSRDYKKSERRDVQKRKEKEKTERQS
jgi:putative oxidoreductase